MAVSVQTFTAFTQEGRAQPKMLKVSVCESVCSLLTTLSCIIIISILYYIIQLPANLSHLGFILRS